VAWSKDAEWQRIRKAVLKRDCGLCQVCKKQGRVTPATQVDHIIKKAAGGTDDEANLQSICEPCHEIKTASDEGRTLKPFVVISEDGWPVPAPRFPRRSRGGR
jgi:5-methylcytosine-specific restriction enzyme A